MRAVVIGSGNLNPTDRTNGAIIMTGTTTRLDTSRNPAWFNRQLAQVPDPGFDKKRAARFLKGIMKERGRKIDKLANHTVAEAAMPDYYNGEEPVQDFISVYAAIGNKGFATFLSMLLEHGYKSVKSWTPDLYWQTQRMERLGMNATASALREMSALLGSRTDTGMAKAMQIGDRVRLQLQGMLTLLDTPSMHRYFQDIPINDAENYAKLYQELRDGDENLFDTFHHGAKSKRRHH